MAPEELAEETVALPKQGIYARYVKRALDFVLALLALLLFWWVLAIVAVLVRIKLGSPVIFKQPRPGKDEKIFTLYKFRSMTDARDECSNLLSDEMRLTDFGKWLRSTSLDELPELFNILKGDMSVVGPRPQLVRDMVFMTPVQRLRHSVRPGLTGLAQIRGRNSISWDVKLSFDLKYIERISFLGDLKIVLETVVRVVKHEGIGADGQDTSLDLGDWLLRSESISPSAYAEGHAEAESLLAGYRK